MCINIHPNLPDLHKPFSSIYSHISVIAILFSCLFFPNLVTKCMKLFLAASAQSINSGLVLPHLMLLTWHLQQLPQCPGVSQEHPLLAVKAWENSKSCSTYDVSILSELLTAEAAHSGPSTFLSHPTCPLAGPELQAAYFTLPSGTSFEVLVFSGDRTGDSGLLRDNYLHFCCSSRIINVVKGLLLQAC